MEEAWLGCSTKYAHCFFAKKLGIEYDINSRKDH